MKKYEHTSYFGQIIKRKSSPRSLLWTVSMTIVVIGLIIYLNMKSGGM
jgi:hypothetical protein